MAQIFTILVDNNSFYVGGQGFGGYDSQNNNNMSIAKFSSQTKTQLVELIYDGSNFVGTHSSEEYKYKPVLGPVVPA